MPRRCGEHPEARTKGVDPMARRSLLRNAVRDETRRTILREALSRYRSELLDTEERLELEDRIRKLRRRLGLNGSL
jgi:hypothetical protein